MNSAQQRLLRDIKIKLGEVINSYESSKTEQIYQLFTGRLEKSCVV